MHDERVDDVSSIAELVNQTCEDISFEHFRGPLHFWSATADGDTTSRGDSAPATAPATLAHQNGNGRHSGAGATQSKILVQTAVDQLEGHREPFQGRWGNPTRQQRLSMLSPTSASGVYKSVVHARTLNGIPEGYTT